MNTSKTCVDSSNQTSAQSKLPIPPNEHQLSLSVTKILTTERSDPNQTVRQVSYSTKQELCFNSPDSARKKPIFKFRTPVCCAPTNKSEYSKDNCDKIRHHVPISPITMSNCVHNDQIPAVSSEIGSSVNQSLDEPIYHELEVKSNEETDGVFPSMSVSHLELVFSFLADKNLSHSPSISQIEPVFSAVSDDTSQISVISQNDRLSQSKISSYEVTIDSHAIDSREQISSKSTPFPTNSEGIELPKSASSDIQISYNEVSDATVLSNEYSEYQLPESAREGASYLPCSGCKSISLCSACTNRGDTTEPVYEEIPEYISNRVSRESVEKISGVNLVFTTSQQALDLLKK